jgi:hypothetical protein
MIAEFVVRGWCRLAIRLTMIEKPIAPCAGAAPEF